MSAAKPEMKSVTVVIGAGSIGQAIARRVSAGKHVLLADLRPENADAAAEVTAVGTVMWSPVGRRFSERGCCQRADSDPRSG